MRILRGFYMKKIRWVIILGMLLALVVLVGLIHVLNAPPAADPSGLFI